MSNCPFRFIHASDFHLERPLMGVAEVPDHLRELFLEAPYTAARQVFEAALAEDAKFVVLSGGIVLPADSGPRGPLFLVEQFARLAERGIGVYWAGAAIDPPEAWPAAVKLPRNVHFFPLRPGRESARPGRGGAAGAAGGHELRSAAALAARPISRPMPPACSPSPSPTARPTRLPCSRGASTTGPSAAGTTGARRWAARRWSTTAAARKAAGRRRAASTAARWSKSTPQKGTVPICRNGPKGAAHKWGLSPFSAIRPAPA